MLDHIGSSRTDDWSGQSFLTSHRAGAACTRELVRLYDEIEAALAAWQAEPLLADVADGGRLAEAPLVRRSPARCLVQVGPVALTVAWLLRAQRTVAEGELLVVVWRGVVGARSPRGFERSDEPVSVSSATVLWETVFTADAPSEAQWGWVPADAAGDAQPSLALAGRCVERLRAAYVEECARAR